MASLFELNENTDPRGKLAVLQDEIPFSIKRIFFVYDVPESEIRGGHRHKETRMVLICLGGQCTIDIDNGEEKSSVTLNSPKQCLLLEARDFHWMKNFSKHSTLLVLASHEYDPEDYIHQEYIRD